MKAFLLTIFFILLAAAPLSLAEVTGVLNLTNANTTGVVTGLYGITLYQYCSLNTTCSPGDTCIYDWDGTSATYQGITYSGWCVPSSTTSCMSNDTWYASGSFCFGTKIRTCSSASWSGSTDCQTTNQTCVSGACTGSAPLIITTGSTSPSNISAVLIKSYPSDFNITQGQVMVKKITVNNTGTLALSNVVISLSGLPSTYYSFDVTVYNTIGQGLAKNYTLTFAIPSSAAVGTYTLVINVNTSSTAKDSKTFKLKILPSNITIAATNSTYHSYLATVSELEKNISSLGRLGADITSLNATLSSIKSKLSQVNSSIAARDYFTANALLTEVGAMVGDLEVRIKNTTIGPSNATGNATGGFSFTLPELPWAYIGVALIVIVIIVILLYLFWPEKEGGYHPKHGWKPPKRQKIRLIHRKEVEWQPSVKSENRGWKPSKKDEKKIGSMVEDIDRTKEEKRLDAILEKMRKKR